jgi:hypothetical protein
VSRLPSSVQDWVFRLVQKLVGFPTPAAVIKRESGRSNGKVSVDEKKCPMGAWEAVTVKAGEKAGTVNGHSKGVDVAAYDSKRG